MMNAITGWADFRRDMTAATPIVQRMTAALAERGRYGEGVWTGEHVAIGHRSRTPVRPGDGAQPVVVSGHGTTVVVAWDGAIYDVDGAPAGAGGAAMARTLAGLYLTRGAEFARHLNGMFAIALWDAGARELLLIRDPLGMKPLIYRPTATGAVFGSEPKALLAHPDVEAVADCDAFRTLFAHFQHPGATVFRGIHEVRPGHLVRFRAGGHGETPYWQLRPRPHTEDLPETVRAVRHLLEDAVARQTPDDHRYGVLLSGGIDSSALAAIAAGRRPAGETLSTFSVELAGYTERFQPHPSMRATPDSPYVRIAAEHIVSDHTNVEMTYADLTRPSARLATLRCQDRPTPLGDMDISLHLFFRRLVTRVETVLSGEGADDIFGGYPWAYEPAQTNVSTFPWLAYERAKPSAADGLGCALLDRGLRQELDFIGYADARWVDALSEVPALPGDSPTQRCAREIDYLVLTRWLPTHLDRADRLSMAAGVQLRAPYCDQYLVEYMYNVPAELKRHNGQEKGLLRTAVADLLPRPILDRPKSAFPTTQDAEYGRHLRRLLTDLYHDREAPVRPLLDDKAVRAVLDAPSPPEGAHAWAERANVEMIIQLDAWLRTYHVRLAL